ncbi:MAG: hypothetical protein HFE45_11630 [Oscillospiraceae bacterium]|jgi:hypothetical protein|nr:hypothetical protein [Oscillospiraceae bacterium]
MSEITEKVFMRCSFQSARLSGTAWKSNANSFTIAYPCKAVNHKKKNLAPVTNLPEKTSVKLPLTAKTDNLSRQKDKPAHTTLCHGEA